MLSSIFSSSNSSVRILLPFALCSCARILRISAWSNPIISRKISVCANPSLAVAIFKAASVVDATLGIAGFLKCAMISFSLSGSSPGVDPSSIASAILPIRYNASPFVRFSCSAIKISVCDCAIIASLDVGFASLTTPTSVTVNPVAAEYCVASIRSIWTWGSMFPCISCPKDGFSPVSGFVVPSKTLPTYCLNLLSINTSYCSSVIPSRYFCGEVANSNPIVAFATVRT